MYEELLKNFDENTKKNILSYLHGQYDKNIKDEILSLLKSDPNKIKDAFYKKLSFGTAGARAVMGIGTNRLNIYTIRAAAKGVANYIKSLHIDRPSCVIGFDNRKNSHLFAEESAKVLAKEKIEVYLFKSLRPIPIVSFAIREKKTTTGIMITASHNTREYNGFKVYWSDGGQVLPPHDKRITEEVDKIDDPSKIELTTLKDPLIHIIEDEIDNLYLKRLKTLKIASEEKKDLKIIYTNLHGTGITIIPKALNQFGFQDVDFVEEQRPFDEDFSNAPVPNPEKKEALSLGIKKMLSKKADILFATDPDADRLGVSINHKNSPIILTGNEVSCILLDHLTKNKKIKNGAVIRSIVTTPLFKKIAEKRGVRCFDVLTGFKYIAELMKVFEEKRSYNFILGAEESCGYLLIKDIRDKDSISACVVISKIASIAKKKNKTLLDILHNLYKEYGVHKERVISESLDEETKEKIMRSLRKETIKSISNIEVVEKKDYLKREDNKELPLSDVIKFTLSDRSEIFIRPSGTEPKIKAYISCEEINTSNIEKGISLSEKRLDAFVSFIKREIFRK